MKTRETEEKSLTKTDELTNTRCLENLTLSGHMNINTTTRKRKGRVGEIKDLEKRERKR